ncbi:MAG: DUF1223 domain-containing protein [Alphaproteobacteria bacterium]
MKSAFWHKRALSLWAPLLAALLFLFLLPQALWANDNAVVVELFTSQGCSSCPPADALLGELATRPDVIALSFPVTYWDYLGWKDTLANGEFTDRQRAYARKLHLRQVYTPQMVIAGRIDVVGSRTQAVADAIDQASRSPAGPTIGLTHQGDDITVSIAARPALTGEILILPVSRLEQVDIRRGENGGRKIAYHNVVRAIRPIGTYDGSAFAQPLPMASMWLGDADRCAVLLQDEKTGAILSAALIDIPKP